MVQLNHREIPLMRGHKMRETIATVTHNDRGSYTLYSDFENEGMFHVYKNGFGHDFYGTQAQLLTAGFKIVLV